MIMLFSAFGLGFSALLATLAGLIAFAAAVALYMRVPIGDAMVNASSAPDPIGSIAPLLHPRLSASLVAPAWNGAPTSPRWQLTVNGPLCSCSGSSRRRGLIDHWSILRVSSVSQCTRSLVAVNQSPGIWRLVGPDAISLRPSPETLARITSLPESRRVGPNSAEWRAVASRGES